MKLVWVTCIVLLGWRTDYCVVNTFTNPFTNKNVEISDHLNLYGTNEFSNFRGIYPTWSYLRHVGVPTNPFTSESAAKGNGVVGVLEANFIEPAHDKQDFERSPLFIRLEAKLKQIQMEYWHNHCHLVGHQSPAERAMLAQQKYAAKSQRQYLLISVTLVSQLMAKKKSL